jgi:hypothetical protein
MENTVAPSQAKAKKSFRNTASFGTRMEFWIIGEMLRQGLDVYRPLVDDMGIDAIIRRPDGSFAEVQIKARSDTEGLAYPASFSGIKCDEQRGDYWFIFYVARAPETPKVWLMTLAEFMRKARQHKSGTWDIDFGLPRKGKRAGEIDFRMLPGYDEYVCENYDFSRLNKV